MSSIPPPSFASLDPVDMAEIIKEGATPIKASSSSGENNNIAPTKEDANNEVDIDIESDNVQALRIDSISASIKLYYGKTLFDWALLIIASLMLLLGACTAPLLGRLYFVHGGSRRWLYTWLQSAGWPINLIPLFTCYTYKKRSNGDVRRNGPWCRLLPMNLKLFGIYVAMGFFTVIDNLLFAWGLSYLPVSTNVLLCASQLAFNAVFSYLLVGQRMTPSVLNSVFAITIGAVLLGVHASGDRPEGTTQTQYILGFIETIGAAALYALILTLQEIIYKRVLKMTSSVVVMEAQTMISAAATVMATMGMWVAGDMRAMRKESERFEMGRGGYALTLIGSAVAWQLFFLGAAGVVYVGSSLCTCVLATAVLPLLSFLSFLFFGDAFSAVKGIAMLLSMWGFISFIHGSNP